jgi:hypothetical protein
LSYYCLIHANPNSPELFEIPDRIATIDNHGTRWTERPFYFQLLFAIDRVQALASEHPEWKGQQPYKSILEYDLPYFTINKPIT